MRSASPVKDATQDYLLPKTFFRGGQHLEDCVILTPQRLQAYVMGEGEEKKVGKLRLKGVTKKTKKLEKATDVTDGPGVEAALDKRVKKKSDRYCMST